MRYLLTIHTDENAEARLSQDEQNKIFGKLTWQLKPGLQLMQSFNDEFWVSPQTPTLITPFAATARAHATVTSVIFGHLTHTLSANSFWDVRF